MGIDVGRQAAEHDERQHHHRHGDRVLERCADQAVHGRAIRSGGRNSRRAWIETAVR